MPFITLSEILAMVAMTFGIGYLFSDYFRKPLDYGKEHDPVKYYSVKRNTVWENTKFAAMIAAPPLVMHELAHKIIAMSFGAVAILNAPYTMYAIIILLKMIGFPLLFFVGGYVSHSPLLPLPSALVAVSGPLVNFAIWAACTALVKYKAVDKRHYKVVIPMGKISLFLGIFNMIPIPGFDGFHFFTSIMGAMR